MKKLINDPQNVVVEALRGIEAAHGDLLKVHYDPNYIPRRDAFAGVVHRVPQSGSDCLRARPQGNATIGRTLITSLEMAGASIALLKLDQEITQLWDVPFSDTRIALGGLEFVIQGPR